MRRRRTRITITFPVINSAAHNAMVVTGDDLADAVQIALGNSVPPYTLPAQLLAAEEEVTWFLDQAAASKLKPGCAPIMASIYSRRPGFPSHSAQLCPHRIHLERRE
ncbi:hypothetical protein ACFX2F_002125 [Malus domestica]